MNKPRTSKTGWATHIDRKDSSFVLFAHDKFALQKAWINMTGGMDGFDPKECRKVEMRKVYRKGIHQKTMKEENQETKKPRAHNHIPVSHREKPPVSPSISQKELDRAKQQAAKYLAKP